MTAHPDVLSALNDAHSAEATAAEKFHLQEHELKKGERRIPKLAKWFDKRQRESADRQHDVRNTIMQHGGTVKTQLGDVSYSSDPGDALEGACKTLDGLAAAHQGVHEAIHDRLQSDDGAEDKAYYRGIQEKHMGFAQDISDKYHRGQQKQQQLKDIGRELFIAKHS